MFPKLSFTSLSFQITLWGHNFIKAKIIRGKCKNTWYEQFEKLTLHGIHRGDFCTPSEFLIQKLAECFPLVTRNENAERYFGIHQIHDKLSGFTHNCQKYYPGGQGKMFCLYEHEPQPKITTQCILPLQKIISRKNTPPYPNQASFSIPMQPP